MEGLGAALKAFNAKERFWLIAGATGYPELSDEFCGELSNTIAVGVPASAWWAMDYHLDWLEAALLSVGAPLGRVFAEPEGGRNLNRNQQDADMVVAWDVVDVTHLVIVEAKGVTSWANDQYKAKLTRLLGLFGPDGRGYPGVAPTFVLASPSRPQKLVLSAAPAWALDETGQPKWIRLDVPRNLRRPERCDASGQPLKTGTYFHVVPRKVPGAASPAGAKPATSGP